MQVFFQRYVVFSLVVFKVQKQKSKHILKNIWKPPKHNLNNNFAENINIYSKGRRQMWRVPSPFEGPVITFGCFGGKNTIKTEHNQKEY